METSQTIKKIAPALLNAQKEIGCAVKGAENPFYNSKYAELSEVIRACKDALNNNGIFVLQPIVENFVETVLVHESGEWVKCSLEIVSKDKNNPQAVGSAISYARRYGLQSLVFIPSEDDDGNKAVNHEPGEVVAPVNLNRDILDMGDVLEDRADKVKSGEVVEVCKKCGAKMIYNPKTGKVFCGDKCWLKAN